MKNYSDGLKATKKLSRVEIQFFDVIGTELIPDNRNFQIIDEFPILSSSNSSYDYLIAK